MFVSFVIPALDEQRWIGHSVSSILASLDACGVCGEVVVADGGSEDATRSRAERAGARVVSSPPGKHVQINEGARHARGDVIAVCHADVVVWPEAVESIARAIARGDVGGWFQVRVAAELQVWPAMLWFPLIGAGINWRTRTFSSATGDQLVFARRDVWDRVGGAPAMALLEGWALARAVAECGEARSHGAHVRISGRRWERGGVWRTMGRMWALRCAHMLGASPDRLAAYWSRHG